MARVDTLPFLTVPPLEITAEWFEGDDTRGFRPLREVLPEWDPSASVRVSTRVMIDRGAIIDRIGLDPNARLGIGLAWHSGGTHMRGASPTVEIQDSTEEVILECEAPGRELGVSVAFRLALVLAAPRLATGPLQAHRPGSVLWESQRTIKLTGVGGRFPMVWLDFSEHIGLPSDAAWSLDWDPGGLDVPVLQGPQLLLNSANKALKEALEDPESIAGRYVLEMLYYDVGRSLVRGALANEDFRTAPSSYREGSLGHTLSELIANLIPGRRLDDLYTRMIRQPVRFERELQHAFGFLQALAT